jgi:predicted small secreted protein
MVWEVIEVVEGRSSRILCTVLLTSMTSATGCNKACGSGQDLSSVWSSSVVSQHVAEQYPV